ncbi:MAG: hypothetical protein WA691_09410 [Thermoplasmata archaeon]
MLAMVAFPVFAAVIMLAGPAAASWVWAWNVNPNQWPPCSGEGFDDWGTTVTNGVFTGYSDVQADGDYFCNPDTTEHEVNAGEHASPDFTVSTTGTYTVTAVFSGTVYVYASQSGCDEGTGHGTFSIGVGVTDNTTGKSYSTLQTPSGLSISESCGSGDTAVALGSVSFMTTPVAGNVYQANAGIDALSGAIEYDQGSNAQDITAFDNACHQGTGNTCSSAVTLTSITVS